MTTFSVAEFGAGSGLQTCILVSGVHVGGGHALARALRLLGVDVLPADEHGDLAQFHAALLASAGLDVFSIQAIPDAWYKSPRHAEFRARAVALVPALSEKSYLFALNDPSVARLVPFWAGVLEECGIACQVVNFADDPAALLPQLPSTHGAASAAAQALWLGRFIDAEKVSRGMVRTHVSTASLVADPEAVVLQMQRDLGVSWPAWSAKSRIALRAEMAAFMNRSPSGSDFGSEDSLTGLKVQQVNAILLNWAQNGEDQAGRDQIDGLAAEYAGLRDVADDAYGIIGQMALRLREGEAGAAHQGGVNHRLPQSDLSDVGSQTLVDVERRWATIVQAGRGQEEMLAEQNATFQRSIVDLTREIESLRQQLADAESEAERLNLSGIAQGAEIEALSKQTFALRKLLGDAEANLDKLRANGDKMRADAVAREEAFESLLASFQAQTQSSRRTGSGSFGSFLGSAVPTEFFSKLTTKKRRKAQRHRQMRQLVMQSAMFDPKFYAAKNPDVVAAKIDLLDHFIKEGGAEGRPPSVAFNCKWYLAEYADVRESGLNPLVHYLEHGRDEGRRRRSLTDVGTGGGRAATASAPPAAQSAAPAVPQAQNVSAEPSELDRTWSARATGWKALLSADFLNRSSAVNLSELAGSESPIAVTLFGSVIGLRGDQSHLAINRVALFAGLRGDAMADLIVAGKPWQCANPYTLLSTVGLGIDDLADGWFSGQTTLNLRFSGEFAGVIRAFQRGHNASVSCIADVQVGGGEADLVSMDMIDPLGEILVVIASPDGTIRETIVIPFPSLMRGGLHHGELAVLEEAPGTMTSHANYARTLVGEWLGWPDGPEHFAIERIEVDMRGANGTEPIFRSDILDALKGRFALRVSASDSSANSGRLQLAELLEAPVIAKAPARPAGGALLLLPCDCLPSIYAIVGRRMYHDRAITRFAVVNAATLTVQADVSMPASPIALRELQHADMPAHAPTIVHSQPDANDVAFGGAGAPALPLAIRHYNGLAWQNDPLMPVSPDQVLTIKVAETDSKAAPLVSAIIDAGMDDSALRACIESLRHQVFEQKLEIVLAGWDPARSLPLSESLIRTFDGRELPKAARMNAAAALTSAPFMLFMDPAVILSDPRTLPLLIQIAQLPGAASAACAMVTELDDEDSAKLHSAGYFPTRFSLSGEPVFNVEQVDIGKAIPAATYPVIANQLKCCVIVRAAWDALSGFDAARFPVSMFDLDFGNKAVAAGFSNYCTTLVRAATGTSQAVADFPDPIAHRSIHPAEWQAVFGRVTIIREMRR